MTKVDDSSHDIELPEKKKIEEEDDDMKKKKKKKEQKIPKVSFAQLFRYAGKRDIICMIIGTIGGMANGVTMPIMMLVFTSMIDDFTTGGKICTSGASSSLSANASNASSSSYNVAAMLDEMNNKMRQQSIYLVILGICAMVFGYFQIAFWMMPAETQAKTLRNKLFHAILKQDIGWFDTYKSGEVYSRLTDDINKVKDGYGDKLGNAIQYLSTFIGGLTIGLVRGWKLTLVILAMSPLMFIGAGAFSRLAQYLTTNELKAYARAGAVAEEVFTAIRTVFAFNGAQKEHKRYEAKLDDARKFGIRKGVINGVMMGFLWLVINCSYALGFWYGWTLTLTVDPATGQPEYTVGKILLVFFSIIIGVFSLGNASPYISTLATAQAAAFEVFKVIDRVPPIDSSSESGEKPKDLTGNIHFKNISFKYPARPDVQILKGLDLKIKEGTTCALVGSSGCGKSTCIQLLQRFYDPLEGSVLIDNKDIKDYNLKCLRSQIGVVNQEPVLFGTSIKENIRFGKENSTDEEIIEAAKNANAHDFIMDLPDKYDTLVGDRGGQLSGGQKQRIAIARALVRNPKILLLDEATSALDNESESIVQAALDKASHGRTTIIVAHRLSTIINADVIFAFDGGRVVEFGNHKELMDKRGIYYNLVITQSGNSDINNNLEKQAGKPQKVMIQKGKSLTLPEEEQDIPEIKISDPKSKTDNKEKKKDASMFKVLALNKPEWYFILFGCIASMISGAIQPAFAIVFSKIIAVFQLCSTDEQRPLIMLYSLLFIAFGVTTFISNVIQSSSFGMSGENLTKRLRSMGFKSMLKQEIGWFDLADNNVGKLCTRLAVEAAAVQGASGIRIGGVLMNLANLGIGLVLALVNGWAIALVIFAFIPFIVLSGLLHTKMQTGFSAKDKEILEDAGKITNEAVGNIRTVVILGKENHFLEAYLQKLEVPYKASLKSANIFGLMLGFSTSITFYAIAAAFSLGAYLIQNNLFGMTFEKVMLVFSCIMFGAQSVGQSASLLPDYSKAKASVISMFELFERVPKINNWDAGNGEKLNEKEYKADISLNSVEFCYPSRPDAKILKGINLSINDGQRVAFVGSSGCGKSTITQLLERFYDADTGEVTLCNKDITKLDLYWLRSQIGIVSQEPILFDMSIAENIAYGDNSREVPMDEIIAAAKKANIHDFIDRLPEGYQTNVGSKGTQLSGGQKQRIAIARALVRNPKILLLDEATSALDTESEKIVQEALEKAQEGRTCLVIAHRLSTIKNSNVIFVLQNGIVTEKGTHDELIKLNGFYAKLNGQQK